MIPDLVLVVLPNTYLTNPLMYFPLGVLSLAAIARFYEYSVEIVDLRDKQPDPSLIPEAHFVGFSSTTGQIDDAKLLLKGVSGTSIIGGAHATLLPYDCHDFDLVVKGEGEYTLLNILYGKHNRGIINSERITLLDNLPMPAWDLLPPERLFNRELFPGEKYGSGELAATVMGSRGCPYMCAFCGNLFRKPVIYLNPVRYAHEIATLRNTYGIRYFRLEDDNITLNKLWLRELCQELKPLNIVFKCHTRPDIVDEDSLRLLYEAGCAEMGYGVESADNKVLRINHKGFTVEQSIKAIELTQKAGIRAKTYLLTGLPGETDGSIEKVKNFMIMAKPDRWTLSRFYPFPGCDVWSHPDRYGITFKAKNFKGAWNFYSSPSYQLEGTTVEEMNSRYGELYKWLKINFP